MTLLKKIYRGLLQNLVHIFSLLDLILIYNLYFSAEELTEEDLQVLHTFSLKVGEGLSEETWAKNDSHLPLSQHTLTEAHKSSR